MQQKFLLELRFRIIPRDFVGFYLCSYLEFPGSRDFLLRVPKSPSENSLAVYTKNPGRFAFGSLPGVPYTNIPGIISGNLPGVHCRKLSQSMGFIKEFSFWKSFRIAGFLTELLFLKESTSHRLISWIPWRNFWRISRRNSQKCIKKFGRINRSWNP